MKTLWNWVVGISAAFLLALTFLFGIGYLISQIYMKDRELRTYVSDGLVLSNLAKQASMDFYEKERRFPKDNQEVGLVEPSKIQSARVNAIEILPEGKIIIHYFGLKNDEKPQILLEAQVENNKVTWKCRDNPKALDHFDQKLLPASCRE